MQNQPNYQPEEPERKKESDQEVQYIKPGHDPDIDQRLLGYVPYG